MKDLSLHILDVVQNSISAGARLITILVNEDAYNNKLIISIEDDGRGMTQEQVSKLSDPFFTSRTTRKVGLGVPLLKHSAEQSGGGVSIRSIVGEGTFVEATYQYDNIDRPPLGDVANAVILLVSSNLDIDFVFKFYHNKEEYLFATIEIKEVLGELPLNLPSVIKYLGDMISENIQIIRNL